MRPGVGTERERGPWGLQAHRGMLSGGVPRYAWCYRNGSCVTGVAAVVCFEGRYSGLLIATVLVKQRRFPVFSAHCTGHRMMQKRMMMRAESRTMRFQSSHTSQRDSLPASPVGGTSGLSGLLMATSMEMHESGFSGSSEACRQHSLVPSIQSTFSCWSSGGRVASSSLLVSRAGAPSSGMLVSCLQKGQGSWSSGWLGGSPLLRRATHSRQKTCEHWSSLGVLKVLSYVLKQMEHSTGEAGFGDVGFGEPGLSVGDLAFLLLSTGEVITIGLMGMGISCGDAGTGLVGESGVLECHSWVKHDMTELEEMNRALGDSAREGQP